MDKIQKEIALKRLNKAESDFCKAESKISALADIIQPYFKQEIQIVMSTDGAAITDNDGEMGFVRDFLNAL